jgi:hypothetical protein
VQPVCVIHDARKGVSSKILARLRRLRFTAEYLGLKAEPICLDLTAPDTSDGNAKQLVGEEGVAHTLEICLGSLKDGVGARMGVDLMQFLQTQPLRIDVWDGDSCFALGSLEVREMARLMRQGRESVYFYDICPFLDPLPPPAEHAMNGSTASNDLASFTRTKEVQVPGLENGAFIALRIVCLAHSIPCTPDTAAWHGGILHAGFSQTHSAGWGAPSTRVPLKSKSHSKGADQGAEKDKKELDGARATMDALLKLSQHSSGYIGWHRCRPDQSALPQRAALALLFVNKDRVLNALRASAHARSVEAVENMGGGGGSRSGGGGTREGASGGPKPQRFRCSEVPLSLIYM